MPIAVIDPTASERFELKTAPGNPDSPNILEQDGFVVLRALPYGMKLTRRDKATRMMMKSQPTQGNKRGNAKSANTESTIELESMNEWAVAFDFANCILDHNLTDLNGRKLDFSNAMAIKTLDPKVGSEIEKLVNSLNEDEDEAMLDDFPPVSNSSLIENPDNGSSSDTKETPKETLSGA